MTRTGLMMMALALSLSCSPAWADAGHEDHLMSEATPQDKGSLSALEQAVAAAREMAVAENFKALHVLAEQIGASAKALLDRDDLKDDSRVVLMAKQVVSLARALHEAGDAGDAAGVEAALKKLDGALTVLRANVPAEAAAPVVATIEAAPVVAGQALSLELDIKDAAGQPVTLDQLKVVHTRPIHLLIVDSSLTDYHHVHPEAGSAPGRYAFQFTPKTGHDYRVWVDVTLTDGGQVYAHADLAGSDPCAAPCVESGLTMTGVAGDVSAALSFDQPLKTGGASLGTLALTGKDGQPLSDLEPVMGAYAHIVGFYGSGDGLVHIHPMGAEPTKESERGSSPLTFHIMPEKAGFLKLYAQIRRGGQDIFVPFGLSVE